MKKGAPFCIFFGHPVTGKNVFRVIDTQFKTFDYFVSPHNACKEPPYAIREGLQKIHTVKQKIYYNTHAIWGHTKEASFPHIS